MSRVPSGTVGAVRLREGEELYRKLAVAFSDYTVFSPKHPRFLQSCQNFLDGLEEFFESHPDHENLLFVHRQGQIYFRKMPLTVLTPPAIKLSRLFQEKDVEGLRFGPGSGIAALQCAMAGLYTVKAEGGEPAWKTVNRSLETAGLKERVSFFADYELAALDSGSADGAPMEREPYEGNSLLCLPQLAVPLEIYKNTLTALHDLMTLVASGGNPGFGQLLEIAQKITSGMIEGEDSYLPLTTVQYTNEFTFNHSVNVCLLVTAAMKPLVKNPERLIQVGQAALLHDLGKSLIPEEILYSEEIPEREQRREIERHPALGADVLQDSEGVDPLTVMIAYDHHRRPNGKGYPRQKRDRPVDILTSIVAAADIFEALTAERPYKRSLSAAEAFEVFLKLPEARGLESAAKLLFETLSPFPPGSFVELDNGERAVVTRTNPQCAFTPWVRLVSGKDSALVFSPEEMDLSGTGPGATRPPRIRRSLPAPWSSEAENGTDQIDPEERREDRERIERRVAEGTLLASEG